jgi:hypothetical protein
MKKKLTVVGIIFILFTIGLCGCTNDDGTFVGKWKVLEFEGNPHNPSLETTWTFFNNGTLLINTIQNEEEAPSWLTYNVSESDNKLYTNVIGLYVPFDYIYSFSNGGNQLSLILLPQVSDEPTWVFEKI